MKAKETERLASLREIKSAIQNEEINLKRELTPDEELTIVNRIVKQTKEELEGYQKATGEYQSFIDKLEKRLVELQKYLPEQLSDKEVEEIVQEAIRTTGATGKTEMGKVMGVVMPKLKGKTDGKFISKTVEKFLSK